MIISRTPLRISLFGGGTDFPHYYNEYGGLTISTAIDKYVYVIVKPRYDGRWRLSYTKTELVDHPDQLEHDLIREAIKLSGCDQGLEIATMADIPGRGSGLGSSSAVTVGTLAALRHANAVYSTLYEPLAVDACKIEIDILKKPIGKQDQHICTYGGFQAFRYQPVENIYTQTKFAWHICRRLNDCLLLFSTGKTRKSETVLAEQVSNDNIRTLHSMKDIAETAMKALQEGRLDVIPAMLNHSWALKKSLASTITNPEIDEMYARARNAGASGGKICGAGGGGYLLLYCDEDKQAAVRQALADYDELHFNFEPEGVQCKRLF